MKRIISIMMILTFSLLCMTGCKAETVSDDFLLTMQINNPIMTVNGIEKEIDEGRGTTPIIINNRTLVPIRAIIEEMGGYVSWEQNTQKISLSLSDKTIALTIDSTTAYVNNEAKILDTSPAIINERTMLPIRFISENLGYSVDWDGAQQLIIISKNTQSQNSVNSIMTPTPDTSKMLVAYFSNTGTTENIAKQIVDITGADIYKIEASEPYTEADLQYYTNGRADKEQADPNARPAIADNISNMEQYDTVFLGYPIWHGQAPKIIYTFLESYDFSGKTIIPFCTSHSSGIGSSDTNLHSLAESAEWISGRRFSGSASQTEISQWVDSLDLPNFVENPGGFNLNTKTVILNSGYEMPINGLGTYSLHGDTCINSVKSALENGVRLIDTASAYGNEQEVGQAVREFMEETGTKREEIFVITKIYPGNEMANPEQSIQACIDRLNIGYVDMMLLHHPDTNDVKAYKAMEKFVEDGKIRSLGLSNWYVSELKSFLPQVTIKPALVQNEIHPYYQENDVIPYIQEQGIVVQGWYPLGGRGHTAELLSDTVISEIAAAHGVSSAQVILRWNLQKGVVVIPGSSNPDHIKENTELYDFELTDEEMEKINALDRNEKHDWY
ncbi:MAG: aldo/keto reductase [Clostridia bacterium]|nr:aldo/keto reductase [Clostridia bacterium]